MSNEREPPGVTGPFNPDCRECCAGLAQASHVALGFACNEHGLMEYDPSAVIAQQAEELAKLRDVQSHAWIMVDDLDSISWDEGSSWQQSSYDHLRDALEAARGVD